jgi:hypothetical protein
VKAFLLLLLVCPCAAQTEAEKLIAEGHWKQARADLEAHRAQYSKALTLFLQSQLHAAFGDRESPLPLAEKAAALDPGVAKYHRQVAEAVGVTAQHSGVLQQLLLARRFRAEIDRALALDPCDVQALRDLLEYYLVAPGLVGGDKEKARATAQRISAFDPVQGFLAQARTAEALNDASTQEAALRKAIEAGATDYRAHVTFAAFYVSRGNWEAARLQAQVALQIDDTRVDAFALLATIEAHRGSRAGLDALLDTAERRVPDDLTPDYRAAEELLKLRQNLDRAQLYLRRYLSEEPEGNAPTLADARVALAEVLEKSRAISATRAAPVPR